jgi:hypothetical protein
MHEMESETQTPEHLITSVGVEDAVIRFFEGIDLKHNGTFFIKNKKINVSYEEKRLRVEARVDGITIAVIHRNYNRGYSAYFRLLSEEDTNGIRDEVVYNRGIFGGGTIDLYRGPGIDLSQKELARTQAKKLEIAKRLNIELNVPTSFKTYNLK